MGEYSTSSKYGGPRTFLGEALGNKTPYTLTWGNVYSQRVYDAAMELDLEQGGDPDNWFITFNDRYTYLGKTGLVVQIDERQHRWEKGFSDAAQGHVMSVRYGEYGKGYADGLEFIKVRAQLAGVPEDYRPCLTCGNWTAEFEGVWMHADDVVYDHVASPGQ